MSTPDNIISFSSVSIDNQLILDNKTRNLVNTCRNILVNLLPPTTEKLLKQLDDSLFELSNKCETHSRQAIYFDAMREIRRQQTQIQHNFLQGLLKQYDQFWRYGPSTDTKAQQADLQSASQFSLLHEDDLEESLAINSIIKSIETQHLDLLYTIEKRFAYMLEDDGINLQNNPVAPSAICTSFQAAICNLHIEPPTRLAIYTLFKKIAEQQLGYFYQAISDVLKQAGILPKLTPKAPQQTSPKVADTLANDNKKAQPPASHKREYRNNASKLFNTLQQLLKRDRPESNTTDAPIESISTIETTALLNALTDIQQQATIAAKAATAIEGTLLKTALQGAEGKALGEVTDDTIDIISLLFEIILDDKNLPDAMKALLGRLQIPILKVAILDKSFFSEKKHPARALLNQLTQAAFTWSEAKDNHKDELYLHIDAAVQRILSEFKRNISLFDEINQEFSTFYEQEQRAAEALEQRMQQISIGKEKLEIARRQVMSEISSRIESPNAQPIVKTLLLEVCKDLLLLINLRQGQQSKAWKKSLVLMDTLLWSTTPKQDQDDQQQLLKQMPAIHRQLKEGMLCISFDPYRMEELLKELRACQIASLHPATNSNSSSSGVESEESLPAEFSRNKSNVIEEIVIVAPPANETVAGSHQGLSIPFNIGSWFEITDDNGNISRAKLAWRSIVDGSLILVNRRGIKVLETSATTLNQQIQNGTARILSDLEAPLIDRALISMMDQLKTQNKKQA